MLEKLAGTNVELRKELKKLLGKDSFDEPAKPEPAERLLGSETFEKPAAPAEAPKSAPEA